jgi:hypothetical protein
LQSVRQPAGVQTRGEQFWAAGTAQVPVPVQNAAGWNVDVEHIAAPQLTVAAACWQAPAWQTPVFPQGGAAAQRLFGSGIPLGTGAQVPSPLSAHEWHAPQLEVVQQTPSTQLPELHSLAVAQDWPLPFFRRQLPPVPVQ